jgi:hypothetical protein
MKTMTVQEVLALHGHSLPTDGEEGTIYFGAGWTSETDCPHLQADAIAEPWGVSSDGGRTYRVTDPAGPQIRLAIFGRGAETYGSLSLRLARRIRRRVRCSFIDAVALPVVALFVARLATAP